MGQEKKDDAKATTSTVEPALEVAPPSRRTIVFTEHAGIHLDGFLVQNGRGGLVPRKVAPGEKMVVTPEQEAEFKACDIRYCSTDEWEAAQAAKKKAAEDERKALEAQATQALANALGSVRTVSMGN